jgi:uncharacterized protein YycO
LPGDFALTKISGWGGFAIRVAQALIGRPAPVQHAMIYVGNGMIVQAMPGGAEMIPLDEANPVYAWSINAIPLTAKQRTVIASCAKSMVGAPYSWLDYLAIGLYAWHVRIPWVANRVGSTRSEICSQLVAVSFWAGGVDLFPDRPTWDVTPADLWRRIGRP